MSQCFVALDFETADQGRDSACALGLIKVCGDQVVARKCLLIRPPRPDIMFTWLHGISWRDVCDKPTFAEHWPEIEEFLRDAEFLAAHNASFDRAVLETCCRVAGIVPPDKPYYCTVQLSRKTWNFMSNSLDNVARKLGLELKHHEAESDAHACAGIVLAAKKERGHLPLPWKPLSRPRRT